MVSVLPEPLEPIRSQPLTPPDVGALCRETFESAEAFMARVDRDSIGYLVLDVRMAGMSGLNLLRHLVATGSASR
jgi:FixJ family two-component response regulator